MVESPFMGVEGGDDFERNMQEMQARKAQDGGFKLLHIVRNRYLAYED